LDGDSNTLQAAKYLVYKLPAESVLIGIECSFAVLVARVAPVSEKLPAGDICLEEFAKGAYRS
jgi:hypothetical protein